MNHHWQETPEIKKLVIKLEALKINLDKAKRLPHIELAHRRMSLLKSAVYSARIEGLPDEESSPKKAGQNLLKAYNHIYSKSSAERLSVRLIKYLHQLALDSISRNAGRYRTEPWAIFDHWGNVKYLAPMYFEVPGLIDEYVRKINDLTDHPGIIAGFAQFVFEKIHPFADGNGRVGRLISAFLLERSGFGFRGLIPFERYIELHRSEYYQALENNQDATGFIAFFLRALTSETETTLDHFLGKQDEKPEDLLLPRRKEILSIISDHPHCSFDSLRRRFMAVNEKTLHYDLTRLIKEGFVQKIGSTRGALYKVRL